MQLLKLQSKVLGVKTPQWIQVATLMKLKLPQNYSHVEMPERRRLVVAQKQPLPMAPMDPFPKMQKMLNLMRGPELVHNTLVYGEFGVQALEGGRLRFEHFESCRMQVVRKMNEKKAFAIYRVLSPWQAVTKKPLGHRMGSGKGNIHHWETPVKPDRMIFEIGGKIEFEEVEDILTVMAHYMPFKARVVTRKMLAKENEEKKVLEEKNKNPFSWKYCAENNMLGIKQFVSPHQLKWDGKYR
ncbi:39S ribosomal protein L16, mitochondrial-like [Mya arenaria]|uniref:39S ribosomal protein L16, mitochondrial-like n=1 Tax=Mya arenaria TaxID=6604 RepID=UPI0022E31929|nr:39S ribosomal protein L16, mitochondrial-like [Mya arenaria]